MNIIEAILTGRPIRRLNKDRWASRAPISFANTIEGYFNPDYFLSTYQLTKEDILANDWEVEEERVEITKSQLVEMYQLGLSHGYGMPDPNYTLDNRRLTEYISKLAELGFK